MTSGTCGSRLPTVFTICFAAATIALSASASADVKTSTKYNAYRVGGTTASGLVSYMKNKPFHGQRGAAVANIMPTFSLNVSTKTEGGVCKASLVRLSMSFTITLPAATSPGGMEAGTRSAWNTFVAFAKKHEETHRAIYVKCGQEFVAKAERLTARSCGALQANIKSLLASTQRSCDSRQAAFDRADYNRIYGLSLFTMADYKSRKPIVASAPGVSRAIAAPSQ